MAGASPLPSLSRPHRLRYIFLGLGLLRRHRRSIPARPSNRRTATSGAARGPLTTARQPPRQLPATEDCRAPAHVRAISPVSARGSTAGASWPACGTPPVRLAVPATSVRRTTALRIRHQAHSRLSARVPWQPTGSRRQGLARLDPVPVATEDDLPCDTDTARHCCSERAGDDGLSSYRKPSSGHRKRRFSTWFVNSCVESVHGRIVRVPAPSFSNRLPVPVSHSRKEMAGFFEG
jgi:hypothetical protein